MRRVSERLRKAGLEVTLVTPADRVSPRAENTGEGWRVPGHLMGLKNMLITAHGLDWFDGQTMMLACEHSGREQMLAATGLIVVGQRAPVDDLYQALRGADEDAALPFPLNRVGGCEAPAISAAATCAGHRSAQELDRAVDIDLPMPNENVDVGAVLLEPWSAAAERAIFGRIGAGSGF